MILMLIAIIALLMVSTWGIYQQPSELVFVVSFFAFFLGLIFIIGYIVIGWEYIASEHKANILNREYQTNYTREEVFYASDVIDTIRELDRKRIELNGDLIRGDE